MLAMDKFRRPFALSAPLVWVTYYLAQLLICLGVARYQDGEARRQTA
jgi:hypothetical protein